jgi:D-alanyl-D-alanine carboxypeptidase
VFLEVAGLRRSDRLDRVTLRDSWHLGSNSKAMTAAIYAGLVQEGEAKWELALGRIFPVFRKTPLNELTIYSCLNHASGLSDDLIDSSWLATAHADPRAPTRQRTAMLKAIIRGSTDSTVGEYRYANVNYVIVAAAIEKITGESWERTARRLIFEPLGLASAGFGAPPRSGAWGHRAGIPADPAGIADNPKILAPAGGIHVSLSDYGIFLKRLLFESEDSRYPDLYSQLTTVQRSFRSDYRLGWLRQSNHRWTNAFTLAHEGSNTLWHSLCLILPKKGLAVVAVSNDGLYGKPAAHRFARRLLTDHA